MLISSVEVLWTARYDYQPHWRLTKHKHEYFQMIYFLSGSGCISLGEEEHPIKPGSLVLVKPARLHARNPSSLVKTLDIKFLVKDRRLRKLLLSASELVEENEPRIADLFERIRHEGEHRGYLYRELCTAFLAAGLTPGRSADRSSSRSIPIRSRRAPSGTTTTPSG